MAQVVVTLVTPPCDVRPSTSQSALLASLDLLHFSSALA